MSLTKRSNPTEIQPNHMQLKLVEITVQNITNNDSDVSNPAFICYDNDVCMYNGILPIYDLYVFEEDKSHSNLLMFISSPDFTIFMALFDRLSYTLYTILTFFQPHVSGESVDTSLSIDALESMPSIDDFTEAMGVVFSWVRISAPKE